MNLRTQLLLITVMLFASCASPSAPSEDRPRSAEPTARRALGQFSEGSLSGWEEKKFSQNTAYELGRVDGRDVLSARCNAAASGLYRYERIDLQKTPYLHWSWRVDRAYPESIDEHNKSGDDFPARVFVVVEGGILGMGSRALNYVWSSAQEPGSRWASPYSDRVKMIAVDAGPATGRWQVHRRDVRADFQAMYGLDIDAVDAVAVMTDCDDSQSRGLAHYGDIYFAHE